MANKFQINEDETVSFVKEKDGLFAIMASSTVDQVNTLDRLELIAIVWSVKAAPFPLGGGIQMYRQALKAVKAQDEKETIAPQLTLGQIRKTIAQRAAQGCNAPHDSYLRIAHGLKAVGADYIRPY